MFILRFYKYIFQTFYWWFYNPKELFATYSAANYTWIAITPLATFNALFFIGIFRMFILNIKALPVNSFTPIWALALYAIVVIVCRFTSISEGILKNINLAKDSKTKRRDNFILIFYIVISVGLMIVLGLIARILHY